MVRQGRSARLAASALSLVLTVLVFLVPSTAAAHSAALTPLGQHERADAGRKTSPEDIPALRVTAPHRLDAPAPEPHPVPAARTPVDSAPRRALGGPDTAPAAPGTPPHGAAGSAAPRGPPHR
ncbi:hypothetical protein [Streptomyces sp. NPDC050504]|uniref:hypothetical protein n=1 Tax=Streptomyces sp. NPDC050504 TaxID=3365618 RepID=UPI00379538E1